MQKSFTFSWYTLSTLATVSFGILYFEIECLDFFNPVNVPRIFSTACLKTCHCTHYTTWSICQIRISLESPAVLAHTQFCRPFMTVHGFPKSSLRDIYISNYLWKHIELP